MIKSMCISSRAINSRRPLSRRAGFTLVELLVVIFILSTLALTGLALTDTADSQLRFEDTQARIRALRRAVIGEGEPVFAGRQLLSGFVADNGVLPDSIQSLVGGVLPDSIQSRISQIEVEVFAEFGGRAPVFDPRPDPDSG